MKRGEHSIDRLWIIAFSHTGTGRLFLLRHSHLPWFVCLFTPIIKNINHN